MSQWASVAVMSGVVGLAACAQSTPYGSDDAAVTGPKGGTSGNPRGNPRSNPNGFSVTQVQPASIAAGTSPQGLTVTVSGTGFVNGTKATLVAAQAPPVDLPTTVTAPTSLTANIPGDKLATAGVLTISIVAGTSHSEVPIMVTTAGVGGGPMSVTVLTPNSTISRVAGATGNFSLNVGGSGFDPSSAVVFNGQAVSTHYNNPTSLDATVTSDLLVNAGVVNVAVQTGAGVSTPLQFTITAPTMNTSSSSGGFLPPPISMCSTGVSCGDLGLVLYQCADLGFNGVMQCEQDGCAYPDCY